MNQNEIYNKIDEIIKSLKNIQSNIQEVNIQEVNIQEINNEQEFENLKKELESEDWPETVNSYLICDLNSEEDKKERGMGIIKFLIDDVVTNEDKFLDFGCGEGHCAIAVAEIFNCKTIGYDLKSHEWKNTENISFTSSYEEIKAQGPYKYIIVFDVLDHVEIDTPLELLKKISDVLAPDGKIYIRCHPWISRHGTHLYQELNKAFVHLVFTKEELNQLSLNDNTNLKITTPLDTYNNLFKNANLKIISERKIEDPVESFFEKSNISKRIIKNTQHKNFPKFQMGLSFIDYKLEIKK